LLPAVVQVIVNVTVVLLAAIDGVAGLNVHPLALGAKVIPPLVAGEIVIVIAPLAVLIDKAPLAG